MGMRYFFNDKIHSASMIFGVGHFHLYSFHRWSSSTRLISATAITGIVLGEQEEASKEQSECTQSRSQFRICLKDYSIQSNLKAKKSL
jgi:hypothetical protein